MRNVIHDMHINQMHFLWWIRKFNLCLHSRSFQGQIKVKSWIWTIIHAIWTSFDPKIDKEVKSDVSESKLWLAKVIWGQIRVEFKFLKCAFAAGDSKNNFYVMPRFTICHLSYVENWNIIWKKSLFQKDNLN